MHVHDRMATLQLFEDRLQHSIAQVHAVCVREQPPQRRIAWPRLLGRLHCRR